MRSKPINAQVFYTTLKIYIHFLIELMHKNYDSISFEFCSRRKIIECRISIKRYKWKPKRQNPRNFEDDEKWIDWKSLLR